MVSMEIYGNWKNIRVKFSTLCARSKSRLHARDQRVYDSLKLTEMAPIAPDPAPIGDSATFALDLEGMTEADLVGPSNSAHLEQLAATVEVR